MFRLCRFYSSSAASHLGKLRKSTGFSISNCKKALQLFPHDLQKAEEWLQSESRKMGWSKWSKMQERSAARGLIGLYAQRSLGIMVEVNCETDFVAKNTEFRSLVGNVLLGCLEWSNNQMPPPLDKELQKCVLSEADLMGLRCESFTLQELLNAAVSKFNEKTVLRRALLLKAASRDVAIAGFSHPAEHCPNFKQFQTGRFGALVAYHPKAGEDESFGTNVCQHVIGMNPSSVGSLEDLRQEEALVRQEEEALQGEVRQEEALEGEVRQEALENEVRLLFQPYLMDPSMRVHEYADGQADIMHFERFECG